MFDAMLDRLDDTFSIDYILDILDKDSRWLLEQIKEEIYEHLEDFEADITTEMD